MDYKHMMSQQSAHKKLLAMQHKAEKDELNKRHSEEKARLFRKHTEQSARLAQLHGAQRAAYVRVRPKKKTNGDGGAAAATKASALSAAAVMVINAVASGQGSIDETDEEVRPIEPAEEEMAEVAAVLEEALDHVEREATASAAKRKLDENEDDDQGIESDSHLDKRLKIRHPPAASKPFKLTELDKEKALSEFDNDPAQSGDEDDAPENIMPTPPSQSQGEAEEDEEPVVVSKDAYKSTKQKEPSCSPDEAGDEHGYQEE